MAFSSFHEFGFMVSIESSRVLQNSNCSFENRKKSHKARCVTRKCKILEKISWVETQVDFLTAI